MDILGGITIGYRQHENYYKDQNPFEVHGEQIECGRKRNNFETYFFGKFCRIDNTPDPVRLISTEQTELLTATSSSAAKRIDIAYPGIRQDYFSAN